MVRRPWRLAFVVYAVLLTVATHWPQLKLPPTGPSDKTIHLVSFGVLTMLLHRTAWFRRPLAVVAIAAAWALLDEFSQGLPGLGRYVTRLDAIANILGVMIAGAWILAVSPVGLEPNRLRLRRQSHLFDVIFARWSTWIALAGMNVIVLVPFVLLWRRADEDTAPTIMLLCAAAMLFVSALWIGRWWRIDARTIPETRPCYDCGATHPRHGADDAPSRCAVCMTALHPMQRSMMRRPPIAARCRAMRLSVVLGAAAIPLIGVSLIVIVAYTRWLVRRNTPWIHDLGMLHALMRAPRPVQTMIDLTLISMFIALLVHLARARLARYYDRAQCCSSCGHDLRGAAVDDDGAGVCSECGTSFTADAMPPDAATS